MAWWCPWHICSLPGHLNYFAILPGCAALEVTFFLVDIFYSLYFYQLLSEWRLPFSDWSPEYYITLPQTLIHFDLQHSPACRSYLRNKNFWPKKWRKISPSKKNFCAFRVSLIKLLQFVVLFEIYKMMCILSKSNL